jgi:hypothetical protein
MFSHPDITGNLPGLLDGNKESGFSGKLQGQNLPFGSIGCRESLKSKVAPDSMIGMNHKIPLFKLREIDRGT